MIAEVIDRLRTTVPELRLVLGAAEYAALTAPPPVASQPAAYVMPLGSAPGQNQLATGIRQRVQETVGVVLLVGNLRDARGGAAVSDLEALYTLVRGALVGWVPQPGWEAMQLAPARLLDFASGLAAWQETFTTAHQIRAT
jgi:hypothetical protein